jgi:hypothetical protein
MWQSSGSDFSVIRSSIIVCRNILLFEGKKHSYAHFTLYSSFHEILEYTYTPPQKKTLKNNQPVFMVVFKMFVTRLHLSLYLIFLQGKQGKHILYGCSELFNATQFIKQVKYTFLVVKCTPCFSYHTPGC